MNFRRYESALFLVLITAWVNHLLLPVLGYRAIGFIFLLLIIVLGLFFSFGPILTAATFSALVWNYFFIPPAGTFAIHAPEDIMMFITYFVVACASGFLTLKIQKAALFKETEKLYQTLLNCISHELKTPLTTIMGAATALQSQKSDNLLSDIVMASKRLNQVFENLLDTTRIESGRIKLNLEWFEISELIHHTLDRLSQFEAKHPIKVMAFPEPLYLFGDFNLLAHALENLILNAMLYTKPGSEITINAEERDQKIVISVMDQGPGIPKELLKNLFRKFYRLPGSPSGGLGLGLSIVKNVVELHKGRTHAFNLPEGGTSFEMIFPWIETPLRLKRETA